MLEKTEHLKCFAKNLEEEGGKCTSGASGAGRVP